MHYKYFYSLSTHMSLCKTCALEMNTYWRLLFVRQQKLYSEQIQLESNEWSIVIYWDTKTSGKLSMFLLALN